MSNRNRFALPRGAHIAQRSFVRWMQWSTGLEHGLAFYRWGARWAATRFTFLRLGSLSAMQDRHASRCVVARAMQNAGSAQPSLRDHSASLMSTGRALSRAAGAGHSRHRSVARDARTETRQRVSDPVDGVVAAVTEAFASAGAAATSFTHRLSPSRIERFIERQSRRSSLDPRGERRAENIALTRRKTVARLHGLLSSAALKAQTHLMTLEPRRERSGGFAIRFTNAAPGMDRSDTSRSASGAGAARRFSSLHFARGIERPPLTGRYEHRVALLRARQMMRPASLPGFEWSPMGKLPALMRMRGMVQMPMRAPMQTPMRAPMQTPMQTKQQPRPSPIIRTPDIEPARRLATRLERAARGHTRYVANAAAIGGVARRLSVGYTEHHPMARVRRLDGRRAADDGARATPRRSEDRASSAPRTLERPRAWALAQPLAFSSKRWLGSAWRNGGLLDRQHGRAPEVRLVGYRANELRLQYRAPAAPRSHESYRESASKTKSALIGRTQPQRFAANAGPSPAHEYTDRLREMVPRMVLESLTSADALYAIERKLRGAYEHRESLETYRSGGET